MKFLLSLLAVFSAFLLSLDSADAFFKCRGFKCRRASPKVVIKQVVVKIPKIKITCENLKCKEHGLTPDVLNRLVDGIDSTAKRNAKVLGFAGRAVGCYYSICATEIYIDAKVKALKKEAEEELKRFSEEARAEAEKKGKDDLIAFLKGSVDALSKVSQLQEATVNQANAKIEALAALLSFVDSELERRELGAALAKVEGIEAFANEFIRLQDTKLNESEEKALLDFDQRLSKKAAELNLPVDELYPQIFSQLNKTQLFRLGNRFKASLEKTQKDIAEDQANLAVNKSKLEVDTAKLEELLTPPPVVIVEPAPAPSLPHRSERIPIHEYMKMF